VKLSSIASRFHAACLSACAAAGLLAGCAATPSQPVVDRLDPDTAATVSVIKKPVELIAEAARPGVGDPFAFLAPFETDRMGTRTQYLWIAAPTIEGTKLEPRLLCDGQPQNLSPIEGDVKHLGVSQAPYTLPTPWSLQWYFHLPSDVLQCLANARTITLETRPIAGEGQRYTVESKDLAELKAFSTR